MNKPNSPSAKKTAKPEQGPKPCANNSQPKSELDGKNDSGPEPEVHGREIPPQ